jgi:hypothetical protein
MLECHRYGGRVRSFECVQTRLRDPPFCVHGVSQSAVTPTTENGYIGVGVSFLFENVTEATSARRCRVIHLSFRTPLNSPNAAKS